MNCPLLRTTFSQDITESPLFVLCGFLQLPIIIFFFSIEVK
jgi:hypothetical protein